MKANAEAQFFLDGRGLFLDYAAAAAAPRINMPADTLHFSNYSGDEALLQEAFKEFEDVIQETRLSMCLFHGSHFYRLTSPQCGIPKQMHLVAMALSSLPRLKMPPRR